MQCLSADVVVIGAGAAGLAAAAAAAELGASVWLVSKEPPGTGDTKISTGLMSVPSEPVSLVDDMQRSGCVGDPALMQLVAGGAVEAHDWLGRVGLRDRGPLEDAMGGHSEARSVAHANRGLDVAWAASRQALRHERVRWLEDAWLVALDVGDAVRGAWIWHAPRGVLVHVAGPVVLATGGFGHLYHPHSDTMRSNTGEGHLAATTAGADLIDMEHIQFTPFGVVAPRSMVGLPLGEAVLAGPRGRLLDDHGEVLAEGFATWSRAAVAGRIARAIHEGRASASGGVWLDLGPNLDEACWADTFRGAWGHVLRRVRRSQGPAAARFEQPWEVAPTAHYCMGGVAIDGRGATAAKGLFAAGQLVGGVHGANRLGSTSLPTAVVTGRLAGAAAAATRVAGRGEPPRVRRRSDALRATRRLQQTCWAGLGPGRTAAGLLGVLEVVAELRAGAGDEGGGVWDTTLLASLELDGLLHCAEVTARAALRRTQSLGAHLRLDEVSA